MNIYANYKPNLINGQCGIGTMYGFLSEESSDFSFTDPYPYDNTKDSRIEDGGYHRKTGYTVYNIKNISKVHSGGCQLFGTGFINNKTMKEAYQQLCANSRLVFQTPVRMNKNSNNLFFYAMFDELDNKEEDGYLPTLQPKWPW